VRSELAIDPGRDDIELPREYTLLRLLVLLLLLMRE